MYIIILTIPSSVNLLLLFVKLFNSSIFIPKLFKNIMSLSNIFILFSIFSSFSSLRISSSVINLLFKLLFILLFILLFSVSPMFKFSFFVKMDEFILFIMFILLFILFILFD